MNIMTGLFDAVELSSNKTLFSGIVFLLTHVDKTEQQKQTDKQLLQDSSLSDEGTGEGNTHNATHNSS